MHSFSRIITATTTTITITLAMHTVHAETRALLIGVSSYPNLPTHQLSGPANDVQILQKALQQAGVAAQHIRVLADGSAGSANPTRQAILKAFDTLISQTKAGDWVIFYFAGHGSQQPQKPGHHAYVEPDGIDEIFLPYDVDHWDERQQTVRNAVLDDEIGDALDKISSKDAKVWAIFDTCHAGGMSKFGMVEECDRAGCSVTRRLSPSTLGVPLGKIKRIAKTRPAPSAKGQVIFFASQPDEPAAEEPLPSDPWNPSESSSKRYFGRFTYLLVQELPRWRGNFSNLTQSIEKNYKIHPYPTPLFLGDLQQTPSFLQKK